MLQQAWVRTTVLITGTTMEGITLVLATFMGGLFLGNLVVGKLLGRLSKPIFTYFCVEMGVAGISVLLSIPMRAGIVMSSLPHGLVILALLLPTTLMGFTVPLIVAGMERAHPDPLRVFSAQAYGMNTLGAVCGSFGAAFWVLPGLGVAKTTWLAAGLLGLAGILALWWRAKPQRVQPVMIPKSILTETPLTSQTLLGLAAWGGAAGMALELVWTRLFSLILGPSVYALGLVLAVYLLGIALGALWAPKILRKVDIRSALIGTVFLAGISIAWSAAIFAFLPYFFLFLVEQFHPGLAGLHVIEVLLSGLTLLPSAMLQGLLLPILVSAYPSTGISGREIAWGLSANTIGAIIGVVAAGLWIVPQFGFLPVLLGTSILYLFLGLSLLPAGKRWVPAPFLLLFVVVVWMNRADIWDRAVLASGVYKYAVGHALKGEGDSKIEVGKILYYREGKSSTVAVIKTENDRVLSIDGKADASAYGDQSTQVLLAALPLSLSSRTEQTLVIGFASGVTAGVSSLFPTNQVDAVEIEPAVYEASKFFREVNHGPLEPPHQMMVGDARHFLLETSKTYDVITSEPSNPWMSGVAPLFTLEFFQLAARRIREGGVMCQWLPIYGMSGGLVASVMATFAQVFPQVMVFESVEGFDLLLIGSQKKFALDPREIQRRWQQRELREELAGIGIRRGVDLVARFLMGTVGVRAFSQGAVINSDDNGYLEFEAPKSLHLRTAERNDRALSLASEGINRYLRGGVWTEVDRERLRAGFEARGEDRLKGMLK